MAKLNVNLKWCKGCGICAAFCPKKVLSIKDEKVFIEREDDCIKCRLCEYRCPDMAINVEEDS